MKCFILVLFFLIVQFFTAQNNVRIFSDNGELFFVYTSDSLRNKQPQASILLQSIYDDSLKIKVEYENKAKFETTLFLLEKRKTISNKEFTYKLQRQQNKISITYVDNYDIINLPKPLVPVKPVVDTTAKYKNTRLGHFCELKDSKPVYYNNIPKDGVCKTPMPKDYLNYTNLLMLKAQIADDKFIIAENVCRNNCLSVEDLNVILNYIEFELEKLKLIKIAYSHITDKQNKKELEKAFRFESSVSELKSFLKAAAEQKSSVTTNCKTASKPEEIKVLADELIIYPNDALRLQTFKKIYETYCYSNEQITGILKLFIHDREKFDAAKMLYFYSVEKNNFIDIADVFSYNETISELKDFIAKQKD